MELATELIFRQLQSLCEPLANQIELDTTGKGDVNGSRRDETSASSEESW